MAHARLLVGRPRRFTALFVLTAWLADVFKLTPVSLPDGTRVERWIIPAGIPRLGEYVVKTIPELRWATLGEDLASWFWRWRAWLDLLVETILIAFMATVLGVIGGFLRSFPAARNLAPGGSAAFTPCRARGRSR